MPLLGLTFPEVSAYDPPAAEETGLDPMGLAATSERLADLLVPGLRARMSWVRFTTAMAVGALATESLTGEKAADNASTPAICFEWLLIEAFVRRIDRDLPPGIPGSQKARTATNRGERLSRATYLHSPRVFGFHGVYKPFAVDAKVLTEELTPNERCVELVRAWEYDHGLSGFVDGPSGTEGDSIRRRIHEEVLAALRAGSLTVAPRAHLLGKLAETLLPGTVGSTEAKVLRRLVFDPRHEHRAELAGLLDLDNPTATEADLLAAARPQASLELRRRIDAVVSYEELAALLDSAFRLLCHVSFSLGGQPLTPAHVAEHEILERCAREIPERYKRAVDHITAVTHEIDLEQRLGEFAYPHTPHDLVEVVLTHHERVQAARPGGKRSWFERFRDGWVVRPPYGAAEPPDPSRFVHPLRVYTLRNFVRQVSTGGQV